VISLLRRVPELWRRLDVMVQDAPLALVVASFSLIPALHNKGTQLGDIPSRPMHCW
jgi:hypothetical protein